MENELQVGQQKIRFDREATVALYRDAMTVAGGDRCSCLYCKNFAVQRGSAYSQEFLRLLEELGINPLREYEAFQYNVEAEVPHNHLYGGWFLFCGELIEGAEAQRKGGTLESPAHSFTNSFPTPKLPKDVRICAVEFLIQIPWVLPESPG